MIPSLIKRGGAKIGAGRTVTVRKPTVYSEAASSSDMGTSQPVRPRPASPTTKPALTRPVVRPVAKPAVVTRPTIRPSVTRPTARPSVTKPSSPVASSSTARPSSPVSPRPSSRSSSPRPTSPRPSSRSSSPRPTSPRTTSPRSPRTSGSRGRGGARLENFLAANNGLEPSEPLSHISYNRDDLVLEIQSTHFLLIPADAVANGKIRSDVDFMRLEDAEGRFLIVRRGDFLDASIRQSKRQPDLYYLLGGYDAVYHSMPPIEEMKPGTKLSPNIDYIFMESYQGDVFAVDRVMAAKYADGVADMLNSMEELGRDAAEEVIPYDRFDSLAIQEAIQYMLHRYYNDLIIFKPRTQYVPSFVEDDERTKSIEYDTFIYLQ